MDVLLLNGPCGVGKTTLGNTISAQLKIEGRHHAVIDLDALSWVYPRAREDQFGFQIALENLSAILPNLINRGVAALILPSVIETSAELAQLTSCVRTSALTHCLLIGTQKEIADRLSHRETGAELTWHLNRAEVLASALPGALQYDLILDTTNSTVEALARELRSVTGWQSAIGE